ncbi:MAG TPA: nuclear transport factor 2 family protein [Mucilaginibacter sp.]
MTHQEIIKKAYTAFNQRDIEAVLSFFHPEVDWPNGWEGGYVHGHDEVRDYWTRQWKELNPTVTPVSFKVLENDMLEVEVKQVVKDLSGNILFDDTVYHTYQFENGLIKRMEISI